MEVDQQQDQDPVMPNGGSTDLGEKTEAVVVPKEDGEATTLKERAALASLPVAPVNGGGEGTADGDSVMDKAEDIKAEQGSDAPAKDEVKDEGDDEDEEDGGDAGDDLFGDDGDEDEEAEAEDLKQEDDDEDAADAQPSLDEDGEQLTEAELERRRRLEYEEEDEEPPRVQELKMQYAQVRLPNIPLASASQKLYHTKLPNFLNLESAPFRPSTYENDGSSNVPVENTIRWRWKPTEDGQGVAQPPQKQTNARVIRWNDGSMSLQLGSEIFDIATDRTAAGKAVAPASSSAVNSQNRTDSSTYLVAQHPYVNLMETQALVTGNLTFRPTAIQSTSHRKIASTFAAKQAQKSKTVMIQAAKDPEEEKAHAERRQKAARKARVPRGEGTSAARKSGRRSLRSSNLADFSDGDDWSDGGDLDPAGERARTAERKARKDREKAEMQDFLASESDEEGDDDDDDEDDDDEADARRQKRRQKDDEMAIADDLDEMEAQAERVARAERKKKKDKAAAAAPGGVNAPQDIDSDDVDKSDDDNFVKKKLVIESDED